MTCVIAFFAKERFHGNADFNASHPGRRLHQITDDGGADGDGFVGVNAVRLFLRRVVVDQAFPLGLKVLPMEAKAVWIPAQQVD